jgi:hypothetical protein
MDAFSSSLSGVNGYGVRIASSRAKWMAESVCRETRRADSISGRVGESVVDLRRAAYSEPLINSPLVGVGDDEDGEEEEENKLAT